MLLDDLAEDQIKVEATIWIYTWLFPDGTRAFFTELKIWSRADGINVKMEGSHWINKHD